MNSVGDFEKYGWSGDDSNYGNPYYDWIYRNNPYANCYQPTSTAQELIKKQEELNGLLERQRQSTVKPKPVLTQIHVGAGRKI